MSDGTCVHISGLISRKESLPGKQLWAMGCKMFLDSKTLGVKVRTMDHGPANSKDFTCDISVRSLSTCLAL